KLAAVAALRDGADTCATARSTPSAMRRNSARIRLLPFIGRLKKAPILAHPYVLRPTGRVVSNHDPYSDRHQGNNSQNHSHWVCPVVASAERHLTHEQPYSGR